MSVAPLVAAFVAVVSDLCSRRIPNWLTGLTAVTAILVHLQSGGMLVTGLLGAGVGLLSLGVPWLLGGVGAGDVKLLAALGMWLGFPAMWVCVLVMALGGAVMAALVVANVSGIRRLLGMDAPPHRVGLPYAVAIFLGVAGVFTLHAISGG